MWSEEDIWDMLFRDLPTTGTSPTLTLRESTAHNHFNITFYLFKNKN
jgi:hypothetical protein